MATIHIVLEEAGARGPLLLLLLLLFIGRPGMGVGTVIVNTDSHCHQKLVDTEGGGSWLVVVISPATLNKEIVQAEVELTMHVEELNRHWEV